MICVMLIARIAFSGEGSDSAVGAGIAQQKGKRMAEPASEATAPTKKARAVADTPQVPTPCTHWAGLQISACCWDTSLLAQGLTHPLPLAL